MVVESILIAHNRYQHTGGEYAVFAAEKAMLRRYNHPIFEYVEHNDRINGISPLKAATNTIWSCSSQNKLRQFIRETSPDIAHFHNTFLLISPSAYHACRSAGVPVVQTLHNYRLLCPTATLFRQGKVCEDCLKKTPPWPGVLHKCYRGSAAQTLIVALMLTLHRWMRTWSQQVDVYIALTEFARRKFIEGGLPAEKIVVKPNFIHPDPGGATGKGNYALFVGRVSSEKGLQTLIQAWQGLKGIPLKIVGDGPLLDELHTAVELEDLNQVELLGRLSHKQVLVLMRDACFLVFPSECYEGFPMTIAEAFACGVPVIASRLGGMAEIIRDLYTGLRFEPGDPTDLATKVDWAWSHPRRMTEMGKNARQEYKRKYTAERNYELLLRIYRRAMKKDG
jgi:glycosyltransferase involved in cell wall biosynthesis